MAIEESSNTPPPPIPARVARARARMAQLELPSLLITRIENVRWLSGFTGSNGFVLLTASSALFATDSRYTTQAANECAGFEQVLLATSEPEEVAKILQSAQTPTIGFESSHLTVRLHEALRDKLAAGTRLVPTDRVIDDLRLVKEPAEIEAIQAACRLADRAFERILPALRPGAIERDVMLELEWFLRKDGRADIAFDSIVASGPRGALPHARASGHAMRKGDFVTLDFGARLDDYCSDITRTVVLGRPTPEQGKVYQTVLDTQLRAIEAAVAGALGKDVHALAWGLISHAGYGDYFGHGLGHSLGRSVHDGPGLSKTSDITLAPGMVMTVEPGIYIPDWGGVRIEDDIVITSGAPRVLTSAPKELIAL